MGLAAHFTRRRIHNNTCLLAGTKDSAFHRAFHGPALAAVLLACGQQDTGESTHHFAYVRERRRVLTDGVAHIVRRPYPHLRTPPRTWPRHASCACAMPMRMPRVMRMRDADAHGLRGRGNRRYGPWYAGYQPAGPSTLRQATADRVTSGAL